MSTHPYNECCISCIGENWRQVGIHDCAPLGEKYASIGKPIPGPHMLHTHQTHAQERKLSEPTRSDGRAELSKQNLDKFML